MTETNEKTLQQKELQAPSPDNSEIPVKDWKTVEVYLADFERARPGVSQMVLKRLLNKSKAPSDHTKLTNSSVANAF